MILNKIRRNKIFFSIVLTICIAAVIAVCATQISTPPEKLRMEIVSRRVHDRGAFTQGLLLHNGKLYESTGLNGESTLRRVDPDTGSVERKVDVEPEYFAEGLTLVGDRLIQITWKGQIAFVYNVDTFERTQTFNYQGEGWGICYDGTNLIMSDGSAFLSFRNPENFDLLGKVPVTLVGKPLGFLNELEFVDGFVYANVWQTNQIVKIEPSTGKVTAVLDVENVLSDEEQNGADVLNGIAYDKDTGHFLITGKRWPVLLEIKILPEVVPEK